MFPVPLVDLLAQYRTIQDDIDAAVRRSIEKSAFIGGEEHELFEKEFARYNGSEFCAGVANGTDAITLTLRAAGVGPGDIVITTPFTFIATVEAITLNGARPVFADIDLGTYNISPAAIRSAVEALGKERSKVKAIIPVHLYGRPAEMQPICELARDNGFQVIEDCAQAHGASINGKRAGNFGLAGTFSFYPGKNLGAYGDAGAIVSNDQKLIDRVKHLRNHGRAEKYTHQMEGVNSRLDGIQAAILRVKLRKLDAWNAMRRRFAALYNELLAPCSRIVLPRMDAGSVFHLYSIRHPERSRLQQFLVSEGISVGVHYPIPLHLQPAYSCLGLGENAFPQAERAAREVISLPLYPEMGEETVRLVAAKVRAFEGVRG